MNRPQDPEKHRCPWCLGFEQYIQYHDEEWGVPVYEDSIHFEFLILESAQAGLSWATILKKREGYRNAFADFDYKIVAEFPDGYVQELLQNPGIIRNVLKIKAAINNAKRFMEIQSEFGSFSNYIWDFVDGQPIQRKLTKLQEVVATIPESDRLAKDLKKRGFKFLGSTTIYAHMQATGLVNDHFVDCFRHEEVKLLQK
ncbi:DNA-3-methyladenine glycosylase [Rhodonellum psychrophilum GCM71 = DSM 17998]|uniref:DNA-3-methyladenine glycosylase n=2 Tax=Rhodonellum TaxID=336827 RepID=U5BYH3_9BACT|nr:MULTISPECIES: DNA-3-methyladenine glycosylase I [Rhodonellum]ERM82878.1 DNA-3-methyladenine glycosylase [Rhodonellum psychrophilum GCM71 = DSM 17998]MDO9552537.1 DNA-3-methyladenine glycosylase I [Rhodonellum sp.]SDY46901.1 DNA-3-methyladenine glycosylase I [Rhodonellum ikkaensis]